MRRWTRVQGSEVNKGNVVVAAAWMRTCNASSSDRQYAQPDEIVSQYSESSCGHAADHASTHQL